MSEFLTFFPNQSNFSINCPLQTEIGCIHKCAKWIVELKVKSIDFSENSCFDANVITSRNFKESFCRLLMLKNDTINPPTFNFLKTAYGSPYISDIENVRPNLPVDYTTIRLPSFNPEFFTFFIEIDLEKTYKSESSKFSLIESDFDRLDYEINLNANIHCSKLFAKDYYIKINTFKIVKSIQYRIECYKELYKNNKVSEKREFFVKIIEDDFNMGVIFTIPEEMKLNSVQTTPLNLMNSRISLKKFYFEIVMPILILFKTPQYLGLVKEQTNTLVNNYKKNSVETSKSVTDLIKNNKKILNNLKNSTISPKIKNEMSQIIFSQLSNSSGNFNFKNNLTSSSIKFKSRELYESPISKTENYKINRETTNSMNKTFNTFPQNFSNFNKYDNMSKSILNNLNSTPNPSHLKIQNNSNEESKLNPPNFINYQPSSFFPQRSNYINFNNYSNCNMNKMGGLNYIQYIDTKILYKKMKDYFNAFAKESKICPTRILNCKERITTNLSNFQIFMTNSTPLNLETEETPVRNFFTPFERYSIIGLDIILKNSGTNILTNYEPSLSSLYIELSHSFFTNNSIISSKSNRKLEPLNSSNCFISQTILSSNNNSINSTSQNLNKKCAHSSFNELNLNKINDLSSSCNSNSSFSVDNISAISTEENSNELFKVYNHLKKFPGISFTEAQPLHNRSNFKDKIKEIYREHPEYENLVLNDITDNSYFSVLWSPIKSTKKYVNVTSFLVFYRFRNKYLSNAVKYVPVIGLITNKFEEEFWLTNSNIIFNPECLSEPNFDKMVEDFSKNKYRYNQVIV